MLIVAAGLSLVNHFKVKGIVAGMSNVSMQTEAAPKRPETLVNVNTLTTGEAIASDAAQAVTKAESRAIRAEADLERAQKERADLRSKIKADEAEITMLQKNITDATGKPASEIPGAATSNEMQAQLDESRQALESAEQEKKFLLDKLHAARERTAQLEDQRKRRSAARAKPGVRGTVMAVNQAYNFVVLNLGGRQGVEVNSEMLVVRDGVVIGKIRISSVEPATAIGDIVTRSLGRGTHVERGDIVVYAGPSS